MKPAGRDKIPGGLKRDSRDLGSVAEMKETSSGGVTQFGSGGPGSPSGCKSSSQDPEWLKARRACAQPILGCDRLGALLLHRLPQPASRLPQGVSRHLVNGNTS